MPSERLGVFLFDEVEYEELPAVIQPVQEYGVQSLSTPLLSGRRALAVTTPQDVDDYTHYRRIKKQAWKFEWNQDSPASHELVSVLSTTASTGRAVWVQQDDEMSAAYRRLTLVHDKYLSPSGQEMPYATPTYPIFPIGWRSGDSVEWGGEDVVVASRYWDGSISVDQETGIVLLAGSSLKFTYNTKVAMRYTWRAYVQVIECEFQPLADAETQHLYEGFVVLHQVAFGPLTVRSAAGYAGIQFSTFGSGTDAP